MNDMEERSFRIALQFYRKWREVIIETDEQWNLFAQDAIKALADIDIEHNKLGERLMDAVIMAINDLYRDGMKPLPAGYLGRDDM